MSKYEINFYRKNDNTCPMEDFLNSLEYKMRAKMLRLIMLLEQNGNELREPYSKFLSDGIYELRARQGNNTSRALYFFDIEHKIILTNGFVKKTRKTPHLELEVAKKYRADYVERRNEYECL